MKYFNIVLEGFCREEDAKGAETLLDVMKNHKIKANSETMLILQEIYSRYENDDRYGHYGIVYLKKVLLSS